MYSYLEAKTNFEENPVKLGFLSHNTNVKNTNFTLTPKK